MMDLLAVDHGGKTSSSAEEAQAVVAEIRKMVDEPHGRDRSASRI